MIFKPKHVFSVWEDRSLIDMIRWNYEFECKAKMFLKYFPTREKQDDDFIEILVGEQ